jgi:HEAT repeat protein
MKTRLLNFVALFAIIFCQACFGQTAVEKAYESAYEKILNEDWKTAEKEMAAVSQKYSQSEFVDDAAFWRCYAQSKMTSSLEKSVVCYEEFIKTYPQSRWANDAKMNLVTAAKKLSSQGKREYEAIIKSYGEDDDSEMKLTALHALMNMDDDKATEAILHLYETSTNPRLKEQMLFILAESNDPRAQQKLIDIVKNDPDPRLRQKAIFWVGDHAETEETVKLIYDIVLNDPDERVREHGIHALAEANPEYAMPYLQKIALEHPETQMRSQAVFWIGDNAKTEKDIAFLTSIVKNDPDAKVREQAIFALSEADDNMGMPFIKDIATSHNDANMRQKAVFWLGDKAETTDDIKFLENIVNNDPDDGVREHAVFAIAEAGEIGFDALVNLAQHHPDNNIRKKAIFWLGESDNERARELLLDIIKN